jgi:hypothetical protein
MKRSVFLLMLLFGTFQALGQERLFSIGYGRTIVTNDSSTLSFTVDINRVPGKSETQGGYYFANNNIYGWKDWGWYAKPSLDINLGSTTTTAANNVAIATPIGLTLDIDPTSVGLFTLNIEAAPEVVSDRTFNNSLYYASIGPFLRYSNVKNILLDATAGFSYANGIRDQRREKISDRYSRVTFPLFVKFACWNDTSTTITRKADGTKIKSPGKAFRRISVVNTVKYNVIAADNEATTTDNRYFYNNTKVDVYLTPNVAFNVTYNYGYEEPLFKKMHSLAFGITVAR